MLWFSRCSLPFFFFNDTATTEIYTLSLHDALPIYEMLDVGHRPVLERHVGRCLLGGECRRQQEQGKKQQWTVESRVRSEEHTSELQSPCNLVCRLLLEKKKKILETGLMRRGHTVQI